MSPEQCQSKPLDRRSDVFSIGILLYELSTLSKLFRSTSDFALLQKIVEEPIRAAVVTRAELSAGARGDRDEGAREAPSARYQTAQALQVDLEAFARERRLGMSSIGSRR